MSRRPLRAGGGTGRGEILRSAWQWTDVCLAGLMDLPEAVLVVDGMARIRWANAAAAELTGWSVAELCSMPLRGILSPEEHQQIARARGVADPRQVRRYHCSLITRSGSSREVSVSVGHGDDGHTSLYVLRDLRRQREVERRLAAQLAEKYELEVFEREASGILHDLRQIGQGLSLTVKNFHRHHDDPAFRADGLRALDQIARQMSHLLGKLSRPHTRAVLNRQLTTVGDVVRRALDLLASAGRQADVAATMVQGLDEPLLCEVDAGEMLRVIFNLLLNAYEAARDRGRVTLRGEMEPDGRWVRLVVEDTGPGFPEAYLEKDVFQPFRSTKAGGLGLGLYQAKSIVDAHGGTLEVANREDGDGARVIVRLPAARGPAPAPQAP